MAYDWTPAEIQKLKTLWDEGFSGSEIATKFRGLTRNAIIGKAHRLGLQPRKAAHRSAKAKAKKTTPKRRKAKPALDGPVCAEKSAPKGPEMGQVVEVSEPSTGELGLLKVAADKCCWPIGHPGQPGFHFCGCPTRDQDAGGGPYCEAHSLLAYRPLRNQPREIQRRRKVQKASLMEAAE